MAKEKEEGVDILEEVEDAAKAVDKHIQKKGRPIFKKYPLTFTIFSITGFAAVIYGFEGVLDKIPFFRSNPWLVLIVGLFFLTGTGTLYTWLQNKEIDHLR